MDSERRQMLKYLHGELEAPQARDLERRLAADPVLTDELDAVRTLWGSLETPAPPGAPDDFVRRALERLPANTPAAWPTAMRWAAAGVAALGVGVGSWAGLAVAESAPGLTVVEALGNTESLAERYISLLEEAE